MSRRDGEIVRFLDRAGWSGAKRAPLAGDASFRRYERVRLDGGTAVLMDAPPAKEDIRPFVAVARYLADAGFSAPAILGEDREGGFLLLEDLGDGRFTRLLEAGAADERTLYEAAVDVLIALHKKPPPALEAYGWPLLWQEAGLFTEYYLPYLLGGDQVARHREAEDLWRRHLAPVTEGLTCLVLRDYHADNLMWLPDRKARARVGLLDFQDAVIGQAAYDLVSLLQDARRDVPPDLEAEMIARYGAAQDAAFDAGAFRRSYDLLGAQRNTKIIGIFTRLWVRDGKPDYLRLIPRVWGLLERSLANPELARLNDWFGEVVPPALRRTPPEARR